MKQYIYSAAEAGFDSWPSGELRLKGIDVTQDPTQADVYVCPGNLSLFLSGETVDRERLYRLPYLRGNESRTAFFDVSDNFKQALGMDCMFIRCDARKWMMDTDPNTIHAAWPVEPFDECIPVPDTGFKYDVSFQGWLSTETRALSASVCKSNPNLKTDIATYSDFTGYIYYTDEGIRRRAEFRRSMKESRIALCPESIPGVFPYRFFEACSAGRVPLLVSSDYCFPFEDEIPYDEFIIRCERSNATNADKVALEFIRAHTDVEIIKMGLKAREYWEKWLDCRRWPELHAYAVRKQMAAMGLTAEAATCA